MAQAERADQPRCTLSPAVEIVGRDLGADAGERRGGIGAHVRARAALGAHHLVLTETPFAAVLADELATSSSVCHHCMLDIDPGSGTMSDDEGAEDGDGGCCHCSRCNAAWYCSEACRSGAAASVHAESADGAGDGECSTLRRLHGSFDDTRDARLLCRIQHAHHDALSGAPASSTPASAFTDLVYHEAPAGGDAAHAAASAVAAANRILPPSLTVRDAAAGVRAVLRIRSNSFSLLDGNGQPAGIGLFLTAAYFNHSCVPNICVTNHGAELLFRTVRPVAAGEELCIAYVDGAELASIRQEKFRRSYGFECGCLRCTHPVHSTLARGQLLAVVDGGDYEGDGPIDEASANGSSTQRLRQEVERLHSELQRCAEAGAITRGLAIATQLASDERYASNRVLHPHSRAVFAHIVECHADTLQCSVQP
jgi:hypothetical protein